MVCYTFPYLRGIDCFLVVFLLPLISFIGISLNLWCILVFRKTRSHPLVPALTLLSLCDILQLSLSILVLFLPALIDFFELNPISWTGQLTYISTGLLSPLLLASNCASIWTISYISIERHRAIVNPLSTVQSNGPKVFPLVLISILAILFNVSKWFEFDWAWTIVEDNDKFISFPSFDQFSQGFYLRKGYLFGMAPSIFISHSANNLTQNNTYKITRELILYPLLVYFIPISFLTCLNLRILLKVSKARVTSTHRSRIAQEKRTISLLISIVLLFFFCHTGGLIIRFLEESEGEGYVLVKDIINILFNVNSMANPMLYFFFTRQFRDLRERYISAHFYSSTSSRPSLSNIHHNSTKRSSMIYEKATQYTVMDGEKGEGDVVCLSPSPMREKKTSLREPLVPSPVSIIRGRSRSKN
ncbi:hypothetical protein PENTCL1PPCAC_17729 [Pristionchus entomophagus]|uniref:G-protein coupled receptors family 1 profile domain-containing protein n=1 Tax=Pristionchus entomophagus TaxID=358040 RepID=A0AAV5TMP6_9BILA|nr:hypothetical protein PENTCL1PPCAC_17729 [Pristionchus entomophagus]